MSPENRINLSGESQDPEPRKPDIEASKVDTGQPSTIHLVLERPIIQRGDQDRRIRPGKGPAVRSRELVPHPSGENILARTIRKIGEDRRRLREDRRSTNTKRSEIYGA